MAHHYFMNFLKLTLFATRVLGLGLRLRQIASTRRRVNAKRTEVRAQKLVKQLPSQFMFVLAIPYKYNRLVLFRPWMFHSPGVNFGDTLESCRKVQTLFLGP